MKMEFLVSTAKGVYECKNIIVAIGRMGKPNKPDYKLPMTLTKIINFNANSVLGNEKNSCCRWRKFSSRIRCGFGKFKSS